MARPSFVPETEWTYIFDYLADQFQMDFVTLRLGLNKDDLSEPILRDRFESKVSWFFGLTRKFSKLKSIIVDEFGKLDFYRVSESRFSGVTYTITNQSLRFVEKRSTDPTSCLFESPENSREIVRQGFHNILEKYEDHLIPEQFELLESLEDAIFSEEFKEISGSQYPQSGEWMKPDRLGRFTSETETRISELIKEALVGVEQSDLSDEEKSQATAILNAADSLANAPNPHWAKVKELIEPLPNVAAIAAALSGQSGPWDNAEWDVAEWDVAEWADESRVPAADRFVTRADNANAFDDAAKSLDEVLKEFRDDHKLGNILGEEKTILIKTLEAGRDLLDNSTINVQMGFLLTVEPLKNFLHRHKDQITSGSIVALIGKAIDKLVEVLSG